MFKQRCCPLCGKKELKEFNPNEQYFVFATKPHWICKNCGCAFIDENFDAINPGKKVSKKVFFQIIFTAIKDVTNKDKLTYRQKKEIYRFYKGKLKKYYKEVADAQAELFYETSCKIQEYELLKKISEKISRKNKSKFINKLE